jgi:FeS assembly SUF system protein
MTEEKNLEDFLPNKNGSYYKEFNHDNFSHKVISDEDVIKCIKTVMDPEIPVNLYDLGLIYSIKIIKNNVIVRMTLTNPNCPVAGQIPTYVGKSIENLDGLKSIDVRLVWEPAWNKDFMSEDAKLALDIF